MIITEFMENGSLDTFLKVSLGAAARTRLHGQLASEPLTSVSSECPIVPSIVTLAAV